jgi:hypothetical protein
MYAQSIRSLSLSLSLSGVVNTPYLQYAIPYFQYTIIP